MEQPLAGISVVELAEGIAGPYAGKLLADFGADVIKIEPRGGDWSRHAGPFVPGPGPFHAPPRERSALFLHLNTNKRSVEADLRTDEGRDRVRDLAASADLVIESFDLDALGLGYQALRDQNPRIVLLSVSSFGRRGPYSGYKGAELIHYAVGGPLSASGLASREPVKMGGEVGQYQCGNVGAVAALAALAVAERSGEAVHVDLSNIDTQVASIDRRMTYLLYQAYTHRDAPRSAGRQIGPFPGGVLPAEDGYVLAATMPQWVQRMLATLSDPELAERYANPSFMADPELPELANAALITWAVERTRHSAMAAAQSKGWPVTAMNWPADLLVDPHFSERGFFVDVEHPSAGKLRQPGAPIRFSSGGWSLRSAAPRLGEHNEAAEVVEKRRPARAGRRELPLAGIRVLDMTVVWAGPYAATFLGDLGADVIRVDNPWVFPTTTRGVFPRPPAPLVPILGPIFGGYPEMDVGQRPWNRVALFTAHARNKRSVTLDLRKPRGRETMMRLVEKSDVLIENNAVELMDKLRLGWEELHARNPRLVMVRLPSVGLSGPYRNYLGFGVSFEALCGLGAIRGYPDLDLSENDSVFHMDAASGAAGAFATLAALRRRERTDQGELVEVSQSENMVNHIGELLIEAAATGVRHERMGNRHPMRAPQGVYRCVDAPPATGGAGELGAGGVDRWVAISVASDEEWQGLRRAMGDPEWAVDRRFADVEGRLRHHDEIDAGINEWTSSLDHYTVFHRCQAHGVPAGPVLTESECYADPHLRERGLFRPNGNEELGTHDYPTHAWRWDGPELAWGPIPLMGADNEAVFGDLLGMTTDEYAALGADGHLSRDFLDPDGRPL